MSAVGDQILETELVRTALFGVASTWSTFVQVVVGRENMPSWDRFWDDFIQEEIRRGFVRGNSSMGGEVEENVALATKGKKGKSMKGPTGGGKAFGKGKGKDLRKVKCWHCQEMGHYAITCLKKKRKGKDQFVATSAEMGEFASRFDQEMALVARQDTGGTSTPLWYIDSGTSRHMSGVQEQFSELISRTNQQDIILGDDRAVRVVGTSDVTFRRESQVPLRLTDGLYVPSLRKKMVSISCIEDCGFVVLFEKKQVYLYP